MEELISIIVPVYNVEKFLERCIKSIINQSYKNLEVILVDDGSKDKSGYICDKWSQVDQRVHVIHKENGGLSDARNVGIDVANGKYLSFIDSDDYVHSEFIKILYDLIVKNEADFSMCGSLQTLIDQDTNSKIKNMNIICKDPKMILENKDSIYCVAWNKLYKRELFDKVRYPRGKINEDVYAIKKILYYSEKIVITDAILYFYYYNEASIMRSKYTRKRLDILDVLYEDYEFFINEEEYVYAFHTLNDYLDSILNEFKLCASNKEECRVIRKELRKKYAKVYLKVIKNVQMGVISKIKYILYRICPYLFLILSYKNKIGGMSFEQK